MTMQHSINQLTFKINKLRSIHAFVSQELFQEMFELSPHKEDIIKALDAEDLDKLRRYLKIYNRPAIAEMTTRQLKLHAARLGISNYSRLSKAALLAEIVRTESVNAKL